MTVLPRDDFSVHVAHEAKRTRRGLIETALRETERTRVPQWTRDEIVAVIPAFNEEATISTVIAGVDCYVREVIVVDDASTDLTVDRAREAGATVIERQRNGGVAAALRTGYRTAISYGAGLVLQLDADGQHNPAYIPRLLGGMTRDSSMVIASRFLAGSQWEFNRMRRWGIQSLSFLTSTLGGSRVTDVTSGFRLYRRLALEQLPACPGRHWAVEQTLTAMRLGMKITEVPVPMSPRFQGDSQFQPEIAALYPIRIVRGLYRALSSSERR